ncbi:hypothetical protein CDD82_6029 [Ophiocordyceps australis]|uniref:Peptidase A1 domain-containing protein n=1 Tax=Ophiocordyceps australis TaxID=1399860 RepID=A0A2C5YZ67_9HYPO|nr:hypothetical protein CDD82_6029 [Ophiocordyceps australis]
MWPWLLLVAASGVVCLPTSRGVFSLNATRKEGVEPNFVHSWAAAHAKWGKGFPHEAVEFYALASGHGGIDAEPINHDALYVAEIQLGTPPQSIKLALDTGSADVWVQSTETRYRINRQGPWAVQYIDKSKAGGFVYRDSLQLGGEHVDKALIEAAQMVSGQFESETRYSGVMGLAKKVPNGIQPRQPSFLDTLTQQLDQPVFSADLRADAPSRFDFGFMDESRASGPLTWLHGDASQPHWSVHLGLTSWSTRDDDDWIRTEFDAVVDTGTSLLFLPDSLAAEYWGQIPGVVTSAQAHGSYQFPCALDLPDVMFKLLESHHVVSIPGAYLNYGPVASHGSLCWGGMQSSRQLHHQNLLGDVMLKAVIVGFDLAQGRVGLANKRLGHE